MGRQVQSRAGALQRFERAQVHHLVIVAQHQGLHLPLHQACVDVVRRPARLGKGVETLESALSGFVVKRELELPVNPAIFLAVGLVDFDGGVAALNPDRPTSGTAHGAKLFGNCVE